MEKILDIADAIAHEKGLSSEKVLTALKTAFVQTAKRVINYNFVFEAQVMMKQKVLMLFKSLQLLLMMMQDFLKKRQLLHISHLLKPKSMTIKLNLTINFKLNIT